MCARLQEGDGELNDGLERLYLVFDDWSYGFSIRWVNLLPGENHQQTAVSTHADAKKFPQPFFRMAAPFLSYFTSAFGTKILAVFPRHPDSDSESYFPMLDVRSQCVTFAPAQEWTIDPVYYFPVGKKLFSLCFDSFEMLCSEELCSPVMDLSSGMGWSWKELEKPPFWVDDITSYSLHPEERTFLVSTKRDTTKATFSFDTEKHSWKLLGNWALPFAGCGHFDLHLKGFVGLSNEADTLGQLYCCDVPMYDTVEGQCPTPAMKLCKENLFSEDPVDMHVGATLVYMGRESKYCLIQCVSIKDDGPVQEHMDEDDIADDVRLPGPCMYRLTTFSLSLYKDEHKDVELTTLHKEELTTANTRQVWYYKVPTETTNSFVQDPVAFWM